MSKAPRASGKFSSNAFVAGGLTLVGLCVVWMGAGRQDDEANPTSVGHRPVQVSEARETVGVKSTASEYRSRNVMRPPGDKDFATNSDEAVLLDPFGVRNWSRQDHLHSTDATINATANIHRTTP